MVTVLIFRSLFLIGAILESSSLALEQQTSRTKATTIPTLLTPVNYSKRTLTKASNWIPLRAITSSSPEYNRFAISTTVPSISDTKRPEYRAVADIHNPYKYYESEQLSGRQFHNVPQNQGKPVNKNYVLHTILPGKFQMNSEPQNFVPTSIPLNNSNRHSSLRGNSLSTLPNFPHVIRHNSYTTHPPIRNEQYYSSNIQSKSTVPPNAQYSKEQFSQRSTGMPTESSHDMPRTLPPSSRESSETFKPFQSALYNRNKIQFAESIPVMENQPPALSASRYNAKPNMKAKIEFSDEDFDTLFDTQLYTSPKSLNIPVDMNGNIDNFGSTKATSMNEHYQRLSDQPQLHFHMNPLQQTLYNSNAFGNIGSANLRGRDRMYYNDLPKRDENGEIVSSPVRENFENMESFETFQNSDFSEMPDSSIFRSYDKIFGKYSKIKPEAFKGEKVQVQSHYTAPRNQEYKQEEEEEEYVDEYRSEESSLNSHEKYGNGKDGEDLYTRGQSDDKEKMDEDTRLENFEESYRKEVPLRGSKYAKETPADSSEQSKAETDRRNEEDNHRSIEIDESYTTTKFPPFRYKSFRQKPLAFASDRESHRSNKLQKNRKESSHSA